MKNFQEAMQFRHACKNFIENKAIPNDLFQQVLEACRLSPSSFGMEHWRLLQIKNPELRQALRPACWNQPQITEASELLVILAKTQDVEPNTDYVEHAFKRRNLDQAGTEAYLKLYNDYFKGQIKPHLGSTYAWSSKQCYMALANMMTCAASLEIDSCPIEGFDKEQVESVLKIDTKIEEVAVVVAFGYRINPQSIAYRLDLEQILEIR